MKNMARFSAGIAFVFLLSVFTTPLRAQIGDGWVQYTPERKVHLADPDEKHTTFNQAPLVVHGTPPFASYAMDSVKNTETFRLFENRSNRSEIRLFNDYEFGSRQFEGYVTFYAPLDDESLMQIWGSETGATEMMIRGYAENGGSIGINHKYGTPRVMSNCYGREIKVNVIHLQEDVGNKIIVYLDNLKVLEFDDNEKPTNNNRMNYHKYGCYGTVRPGHENPVVQWRNVRHFKDGRGSSQNSGTMAIKGKLLLEDDFKHPAEYTKEFQPLKEGWKVKAWHATFKHTSEGLESVWETGHNPVIAYECSLQNVIVEVDFRFRSNGKPENNAYCRVNFTNKELDPRAYCLSTWMNASVKSRPAGINLEHEKWEPQGNTAVSAKFGKFEPDTWYTVRLEVIGDSAQVSCNGMTVAGRHPKFRLPKTQLVIGVGKSPHEIRRVRVYEALPNPAWKMPNDKTAVPVDSVPGRYPLPQTVLDKINQMRPLFDGKTLDGWIQEPLAPVLLEREDVIDPVAFAKQLSEKKHPVSKLLGEKLDSVARKAVSLALAGEKNTRLTVSPIIKSINNYLKGGAVFYSKTRFKGVVLRQKTRELLAKNPQGSDLARLNRLLLEDAFPGVVAASPDSSWVVKNGVIAGTGAGRGVIYTQEDFGSYRLIFQVRQTSGNHFPGVLLFCQRPSDGKPGLDALGGIQFAVPSGGHWDYRPGINRSGDHFRRPLRIGYKLNEWAQVEILVNAQKGTARMAIAQPAGTRAIEVLTFDDPSVVKKGPIALQMHNALLFDEYKDLRMETDPKEEKLITLD